VSDAARAPRAREAHLPALDGLRGLAVAAVFLFHCGVPWMAGGFLGVSTFFTLSGFLITALLRAEWQARGRIDLGRFWERRVRRLVPAGLLVVAAVLVLAPWLADGGQRRTLPADARAALFYWANWHYAAAPASYADLFEAPSLLLHTWSLGVEAQFYLVFPLLVALAARWRGRVGVGLAVSTLGLASALATVWAARGPDPFDRVYYGTDTRALELLVGAVVALLPARLGPRADGTVRTGVVVAGTLALAGQVALWTTTTMAAPWVTRGGLGTYAIGSALVVLAALEPRSPVRALLSWAPLRRLGEISYGFYLLHWPIVLWLTPERIDCPPFATNVLRAALTVLLASASYRWLEAPIRERRWWPGRRVLAPAALASCVLGALTVALPVPARDPVFAELERASAASNAGDAGGASHPDAVRYAVFGDSTAAPTARAFETWIRSDPGGPRFAKRAGRIRLGCGIMGPAERRDVTVPEGHRCPDVVAGWAERVRAGEVDLALVQTGAWESREHALRPGGAVLAPGDPEFDAHLRRQIERVVDALADAGAAVVWVLAPHIAAGKPLASGGTRLPPGLRDPARIDRYNAAVREIAATRSGRLATVDLSAVLAAQPGGEASPDARPDGMHLTTEAADRLAPTLGPAIAAAYEALRSR
jgi:peptidoglycan/LPS O-acetylase OafA/YrhL